jgi:hypothetical protein
MLQVSPHPVLVHFPHPGTEHNPGTVSRQPWNTGEHRRKFLRTSGRYVAANGSLVEAQVAFWGEWEAPSYIVSRWAKKDELPSFLHDPVWEDPTIPGFRQNTDPWVFGDCFRYSNCHQLNQIGLRRLAAGSVILFGSSLGVHSEFGPRFVLDTVFVIGTQSHVFSPADPPKTEEAFRICSVDALGTGVDATTKFTLYRGATYEAPINNTYSFIPCRRVDGKQFRFARPSLSLSPDVLNPRNWRTPSGANRPLALEDIREYWSYVRGQVVAAGCLIGVHLSTPRKDN